VSNPVREKSTSRRKTSLLSGGINGCSRCSIWNVPR